MSSNYKKSAKDIAFDNERAKYNKQIRELQFQLKEKDKVIAEQNNSINAASDELYRLRDWVRRLLEYAELSEEDMKKLIDKDMKSAEIIDRMSSMSKMFSLFSGKYI